MKTKIISFGILLCVIAACGVTNSKKSHNLDGLWMVHHLTPLPCQNGGTDNCGRIETYLYALIDYPNIHLCKKESGIHFEFSKNGSILSSSADSIKIKEDVEVVHSKENVYNIEKVNDNIVNKPNIAYKLNKDTSSFITTLDFEKMENGKIIAYVPFESSEQNDQYQKCRKVAVDTTNVLTDTLRLNLGS